LRPHGPAREAAIRDAADTMSTRQIARHVSVTAQRVQQIAASRDERGDIGVNW
jgi:hypothetical protein